MSQSHEFTVTPQAVTHVHPTEDQCLLVVLQATSQYYEYKVKLEAQAIERQPITAPCFHMTVSRYDDADGGYGWRCNRCGKGFTP